MDTRITHVKPNQRHNPTDGFQSMAAPLSAFPVTTTIHGQPTTGPGPRTSFNLERPTSSISRRHSWTSSYEISAPVMLVPEDYTPTRAVGQSRPAGLLPRLGATFDMAYFIKNTGPPPAKEEFKETRVDNKKKNSTLFRKRKGIAASPERPTWKEKSLDGFVPSERVEQKVTLKGS
jgi:hypothetical protein